MKRSFPLSFALLGCASFAMPPISAGYADGERELPNVLWITSEDTSPYLGCYGDSFAKTPNLDRLAEQGFLYSHAYANSPISGPARNTIITGVYASSNGNQHMRSRYPISGKVKTYPEFLRERGYYCTNNSKTDYQTDAVDLTKMWDECSVTAHYKNRAKDQPFFAVFNITVTHESSIHTSVPEEKLRHNPKEVSLPPYHPDTPELRHDWAQYYDKIEELDIRVGELLQELENAGLADNTLVFYYGDHGGILARSKYYLYETGTRVPFIIRIPYKYKHLYPSKKPGSKVGRLISFVDLAPTLLSIVGIAVPDYLQGNAFLGEQKTKDPEYVFMFRDRSDEQYDMFRSVRSKKYRYICNYMPYRNYGHHMKYLFLALSATSWKEQFSQGRCNNVQSIFWNKKAAEELYDTENDPWEINNLAGDISYRRILERMRKANITFMTRILDTGFIPEADLIDLLDGVPAYDYMRTRRLNLSEIIQAAEVAIRNNPDNLYKLQGYLKSSESAVRYWGATGILILGNNAISVIDDLKAALTDKSANVVTIAAEALYNLGEKELAEKAFTGVLGSPNKFACCHALNAIDCLEMKSSPGLEEGLVNMLKSRSLVNQDRWNLVAGALWLFEKWGINPGDYGIVIDK